MERPHHPIRHSVGYFVSAIGPTTFRPHEVIFSIADKHRRPFDIPLRGDLFDQIAIWEGCQSRKISIELTNVAMPPATVNDVVLLVFVLKNELVNGLRFIVKMIDQRFAQIVSIRAFGPIGHRNPNATHGIVFHFVPFGTLDVIGRKKQEILFVFFYDRGCPHGHIGPFDCVGIENSGVLFPVYEVFGRKGIQKNLGFVFG